MTDTQILVLVGSLRSGSVNAATARAAMAAAPAGITFNVFDLSDVPMYNGDVEEAGIPSSVQALHDAVGAADGLLIFSPEYNGSFPAVTKNAIDWMTRPPKSWENTALSIVVTTPGRRAGESFRGHFQTIMEYQPVRLFESFGVGSYPEKLGDDGEIADDATKAELGAHVGAFAAFAATS